ncbi:MAG: pseudouridine synthase [Cyanobacteriota bacterium]|nr:pseudouridine synthase [Cyanobacteriota bacterium]
MGSLQGSHRLQKVLAHLGVASRRQAEGMIVAGRVQVNQAVIRELGYKVDLERDEIWLDGRRLSGGSLASNTASPPATVTLLLHKPVGILSTCRDPQQRRTVLDLLPTSLRQAYRLYPVGRLDRDSTGAILLTNDGELALRLTHPRYHIPKTYRVGVKGRVGEATLQQWREGVDLEEGTTLPAQVDYCPAVGLGIPDPITPPGQHDDMTWLMIVMREGRKRQIRRIADYLGHPVVYLHRQAIGSLSLGALLPGQFRWLSSTELANLHHESQADHVC